MSVLSFNTMTSVPPKKLVVYMVSWTYRILAKSGTILTQDPLYAEFKSKTGYQVFCTRDKIRLRIQY